MFFYLVKATFRYTEYCRCCLYYLTSKDVYMLTLAQRTVYSLHDMWQSFGLGQCWPTESLARLGLLIGLWQIYWANLLPTDYKPSPVPWPDWLLVALCWSPTDSWPLIGQAVSVHLPLFADKPLIRLSSGLVGQFIIDYRRIAGVCFELHFRMTPGQFRSAAVGLDCYTVSFTAKIYSTQRYETVNDLAMGRKQRHHCIIPS